MGRRAITRPRILVAWSRRLLLAVGVGVAAAALGQSIPPPPLAPPAASAAPQQPADANLAAPSGHPSVEPASLLDDRFQRWLEEVEPLITGRERALFLRLKRDYQRDAFIQKFWQVRDPYPRTARNELKERWPLRLAEARSKYETLEDDRARVLLVHGEPHGSFAVRCTKTRSPAEVWAYQYSESLKKPFLLVFVRHRGVGVARLWRPFNSGFSVDQVLAGSRACINGSRLQQVISNVSRKPEEYSRLLGLVLAKPRPRTLEWLYTFVAQSTDLKADEHPFPVTVDFAFLGKHQNRTVVQGLLAVPTASTVIAEFAGYRSHDFLLTGEVVKDDVLFESFRYKFGFPAGEAPEVAPLSFQRYLRPGTYQMILKLEDLNSAGAFRSEQVLEVPRVENTIVLPAFKDPDTARLFEEATAAVEAGETGIRIVPPSGELHTGFLRFDTLVSGSEIEKVRFYLDDRRVLTKNRPPYNVSIDLGTFPDLHALRVEALDTTGHRVATDEVFINAGGYRFAAKLVEPRPGRTYTNSLRAQVEVEVPAGRVLERVEIYLNEALMATLYQEPFVQPLLLPATAEVSYVRAVAYLPDGNSTEDLVFVNALDYLEEVDIQFVELYTTALDRQGRPVEGLSQEEFKILEDDVPQSIARFERVENLPIHAGILIDNSASMIGTLDEVRRAALSFFQQAIAPRDRAAVITFNSFPNLAVKLTNDRALLGAGLAGLTAEGETALYDSLMFALYYFTGIKGQRAILVLSDGQDESSRFSFEETLEYARRAGITIYPIGLHLRDASARNRLRRLADETGGRSFFIRDSSDLEAIYSQIQQELRSQYLIAYQSSNTAESKDFRTIELTVDRPGVSVKSLSGYYP